MKPTAKTKISRLPKRGNFEPEVINAILDEALVCTIAYCIDGQAYQIPTGFCRLGNKIYIHGSVKSHFLLSILDKPVSIGVTLLDGLVMARSAFHHSMNYRSVVAFSKGTLVKDKQEIDEVLKAFTNKILPDRWDHVRIPNEKEMKQTIVVSFTLEEASAKIRTGNVNDDEEDKSHDVWAGVVPLRLKADTPVPDPEMPEGKSFRYSLDAY